MNKHAVLRYTSLRITVFGGCILLVWLIAMTGVVKFRGAEGVVLLFGVAALISAPVSYVLLSRQRDAMSAQIVDKVETTKLRLAENRTAEDAADEAARVRSESSDK